MDLNNNDDPHFERRLILAFALAVMVFLIAMPYLNQKTPAPAPSPAHRAATATPPPSATAPPAAATVAPPAGSRRAAAPAGAAVAAVEAAAERLITIDTPVFHIVLSNRGGTVRAWVLKDYRDASGRQLDLVDAAFAAGHGYPLAFWTPDAALRAQLADALFVVTQSSTPAGDQTVSFHWSQGGADSLVAEKSIVFDQGYVTRVAASLELGGAALPAGLVWQGGFGDRAAAGEATTQQFIRQSGTKLTTVSASKLSDGSTEQGQFHLAGIEDQFFAAIFLPAGDTPLSLTTLRSTYQPAGSPKPVVTPGIALGDASAFNASLFVGPKRISLLKSIDPALRGLVDFGWFSFLADPLFLWMNWTYQHWIHNYGWVIIFITFVITLAGVPLRMKSQKSQAKMLALQPKVNALNAKMKKYPMRDPRRQEVQQEIMKIYSDNGVNPLGGCLPMMITLPLIFAFYKVLEYAIELRHAPWIGYLHDLSVKDPYYILPVVMIVSQFYSMSLMPPTPGQDPKQAKMMKWLMPTFMGYIFFFLPSGVNLYYLTSNVMGIGVQVLMNRMYAVPVPVPAAGKRKVIEGTVIGRK